MKKYLTSIASLAVLLIILIPFASKSPDGLEKVADTLQVETPAPIWKGLISNYLLGAAENSPVSSLLAGIFGMLTVFLATLAFGTIMAYRKRHN
jgi:hypothetical protein